ncbi:hypothetical protein HDZ31DRAFT_85480 [Schizophyllum fasciatum]
MYTFCYMRGLREVWGYLWANWYSLQRWPLWARSTSPRLTRLRTTMTVENFWRQLKHNDLHHLVHPRIDQLVHILIHSVTPAYYRRMQTMSADFRLGRSTKLTTHQKYFKVEWRRLSRATVSGKAYETDVRHWICNCGRQKYSAYHICKHLVQAVRPPPIAFWNHVHRRRTIPLYRHPALIPSTSDDTAIFMDPESGCISDGDDNLWSGDPASLEDGGWRSGRLAAAHPPNERADDAPMRPTCTGEGADTERTVIPPVPDSHREASSLQGDASDDEADMVRDHSFFIDSNVDWLREKLAVYERGINLLKRQLELPSEDTKLLFARLRARKFGSDMEELTKDMQHVESSGRKRSTTWARPGDSSRKRRRLNNTLGYHRTSSTPSGSSARSSSPAAGSVIDVDALDSDAL